MEALRATVHGAALLMRTPSDASQRAVAPPAARWQRGADRLARSAWRLLLLALALGLLGGVATAIEGPTSVTETAVAEEEEEEERCPDPPCFDLDIDLSRVQASTIPGMLQLVGFVVALLLSVPSLLAGGWDLLRARWAPGGRRLLAFAGPALVLLGTELLPHALACPLLPWTCEQHPRHGLSIAGQWHQLDHMLFGAVPLIALYGWVRRR